MMSSGGIAVLVCIVWLFLGTFVCSKVISARRVIQFSTSLYESGKMQPSFMAFARRDANELPSLIVLIVRSYTVGVLCALLFGFSVLVSGISAIILPSRWLGFAVSCCSRLIMLAAGIRVEERGLRAHLKEAPCLVANHNSAFDIILLLTQGCCFVSMDGVRNIPIVGKVAEAIGCIFVARDSKDSRQAAKEKIANRLQAQISGKSTQKSQLVVFPEGSTNNGYALLEFRRGAFEPNVPIQPVWIEFEDHSINFTVLSLSELAAIACTLPGRRVVLHWCPVIQPEDDRSPEATAALARNEIASLTSAFGHKKLELVDASVSHRDAIACANYMMAHAFK